MSLVYVTLSIERLHQNYVLASVRAFEQEVLRYILIFTDICRSLPNRKNGIFPTEVNKHLWGICSTNVCPIEFEQKLCKFMLDCFIQRGQNMSLICCEGGEKIF